jgi:methylmalonyl-CoA mutase C-terminal domain/subunit
VDVIGLSCLSGAHLELFSDVMKGLGEKGMESVTVVAGGIIPEDDVAALEKMGIKAVFGPGAKTTEIADAIKKFVLAR